MLKKILVICFAVFALSASCQNKVQRVVFNEVDGCVAEAVNVASSRCFSVVSDQNLEGDDAYHAWEECMIGYHEIVHTLDALKTSIAEETNTTTIQTSVKLINHMRRLNMNCSDPLVSLLGEIE